MQDSIKELFAKNGFKPAPDLELTALLKRGLEYMAESDLVAYIEKVKRFNERSVEVIEPLPGEFTATFDHNQNRIVHWYDLRENLETLPKYFDVAKELGLTHEERINLLFSMVDSYKYDHRGVTGFIKSLTKIMENCAEKGTDFKADIPQLQNLFQSTQKDGEIDIALSIVQFGTSAGMSIQQSVEIVTDIYKKSGLPGYVFRALYDPLHALETNNADGELIFRSLKAIIGDSDPYYKRGDFSAFTELLYGASTHTDYSQAEILEKIIAQRQKTTASDNKALIPTKSKRHEEEDILFAVAEEIIPISTSDHSVSAHITKKPHDYFPDIKLKKLVHGILPYRAKRNLAEGLHDLHDLMKTELQEGAWVFDPKSDTWYSLGGRTDFQHQSRSLRQEFTPYDVAKLSPSPIFVHIHPEDAETFVVPKRESLVYSQLQWKITKFLASMPSGADFQTIAELMAQASQPVPVLGLVVTSTGLTEIRVPNDPQRIAKFAETFRDLKDEVLLKFDAKGYLKKHGIGEPDAKFVKRLLSPLNEKLPDDFKIIVHDYDQKVKLDISRMQQGKARNKDGSFPICTSKGSGANIPDGLRQKTCRS